MGDTATTGETPTETTTTTETVDETAGLKSALEKERAARKEAEKAAKEGKEAAAKLAELEDGNRSEIEKATAKAAEAERRAQEAEQRALRLEVAAEKGLTAKQAARLQGTTREDLEADADELLADFAPAATTDGDEGEQATEAPPATKAPATRPKEALKSGAAPATTPPDVQPGMGRLRAAYANSDQ